MSAFVVSKKHIDALVTAAVTRNAYIKIDGEWVEAQPQHANLIGQTLWNENYRSVNARYNESEKAPEYHWTQVNVSAVQVIKAVHCLDYQSCETDDWNTTQAYQILKAIKNVASYMLPGYEEAQWEIR